MRSRSMSIMKTSLLHIVLWFSSCLFREPYETNKLYGQNEQFLNVTAWRMYLPVGSVVDSQTFLSRRNRILKTCFCGTEILKGWTPFLLCDTFTENDKIRSTGTLVLETYWSSHRVSILYKCSFTKQCFSPETQGQHAYRVNSELKF